MTTSTTLRISLVQMPIEWEDATTNLRFLDTVLAPIADFTDIIVLPEMFTTGFSMMPSKIAQTMEGPVVQWMLHKAIEHQVVIAGTIAISTAKGYFNRFLWVFPNGDLQWYDKKHLFAMGGEDRAYQNGHTTLTLQYKGWRLRPLVCYDLRFPVWSSHHDDYDVLFYAANWPQPRIHHWDALLKARAIENQSYVIAVNRTGADGNGLHYNGHSQAIDMNGQSICFSDQETSIQTVTLDKTELVTFRQKLPFLQDNDLFQVKEKP